MQCILLIDVEKKEVLTREHEVSLNIVPISCIKCYIVIAFNIRLACRQVEYLVDNLQDDSIFITKLILWVTVSTI